MFVHIFQLRSWTRAQQLDPPKFREIGFISNAVFDKDEGKVRIRQADMGTTRYAGDDKQPRQLFISPGRPEERALLGYLLAHSRPGISGRRTKSYFCFVQTEEPGIFYIKGIYSTVRATKDIGPVDLIATYEHRGGKRDLGFDPPEKSHDIWGLGT